MLIRLGQHTIDKAISPPKPYHIGIVTYDSNHAKTDFVLTDLLLQYDPAKIKIYALPFIPRKERAVLFAHRPNQMMASNPKDYAQACGLTYAACQTAADIDGDCDFYVITGAGLLPAQAVENKKIINVHPGFIPAVRGLDSFKWAILEQQPMGITLHLIDKHVDQGIVISNFRTPIFHSDTIESFAARHYFLELIITSHFEQYLMEPQFAYEQLPLREGKRRMPPLLEKEMLLKFDDYKAKYAQNKKEDN